MKIHTIAFFSVFFSLNTYAQTDSIKTKLNSPEICQVITSLDSIKMNIELINSYIDLQTHIDKPRYQLFPTKNTWTLLKLDTRNGRIWQVQYSIEGDDYRFEIELNSKSLAYSNDHNGRFTLIPTPNTYNFILLDQIFGYTYQVQWSTVSKERMIIPIN